MTHHWAFDAIFYHIYPLGFCDAPERNDFVSGPLPRLTKIETWLEHLQALGINALYLGPVFESTAHGYDTADYYRVDRRLGSDADLVQLVQASHARGMRVILDGVFNHVGRDFWAFRDLQQYGEQSAFRDWFHRINFTERSPYGDFFSYEGWSGHYDLIKLNLQNPAVKQHLLQAVAHWVETFAIDGLRLDVADSLDKGFLHELAQHGRGLRPDFWLMGEVIHGNYTTWANPGMLDAVTNYEAYKGLFSSLNDRNYFEIAHTLKRQFGAGGIYEKLPLYNFADNHDVHRVASTLHEPGHLPLLYTLLFTMPGVPSIYYGSEWGLAGQRTAQSDRPLRPSLDLAAMQAAPPLPGLAEFIARLAQIRQNTASLRYGDLRDVSVALEQYAFARDWAGETSLVLLNAAANSAQLTLSVALADGTRLTDQLAPKEVFWVNSGRLYDVPLQPRQARILSTAPC